MIPGYRSSSRGVPCASFLLLIGPLLLTGCGDASFPRSAWERSGDLAGLPDQNETTPTPTASKPQGLLEGLAVDPHRGEAGESGDRPQRNQHTGKVSETLPAGGVRFSDVHGQIGLEFVCDNGASRKKLMVESTAGGAGWLDYDSDGWPDLYLPQGGNPFAEDQMRRPSNDQLFRNVFGRAFVRVTEQAGISDAEFGHGVAVGDFDNDGFDDVYVTNVGPDILYHNNGDGTFTNVTKAAGIDSRLWGSSAAWGDLDSDGDLDLYVCNYVDYDPRHPIACLSDDGKPGICHPLKMDPVPNRCFLNLGDGTFRESAEEQGLTGPGSKALGLVIADFNGDTRPDVYVANDTAGNHLFLNQGGGRFQERALLLGCAYSGLGQYQASMGVAFGDYDNNGFPDLYLTHFTKDSNTLYANYGPQGFEDTTRSTGLHLPTLKYLGFGTVMADFDFNGRQELFVANGHIDDWRKQNGDLWYMPAQLFTFDGRAWQEVDSAAGPYFDHPWLGRAVASADFDNDNDLDLLVIHQNDPAALLRNDSQKGHWLKMQFVGIRSNRRGIGVEVTVVQGSQRFAQQLPGGTSYCASHQPVLFFGLGDSAHSCNVQVLWPSGQQQTMTDVAVDQSLVLYEPVAERGKVTKGQRHKEEG